MKPAWPREPSAASTTAVTTCTFAMPPLVAQAFWPLSTHSSVASSYRARVRYPATSEPAWGSEAQNAASFGSDSSPKHSGTHSASCSGSPPREDARDGETGAHQGQGDAGVTPEQFLGGDRQRQPDRVGEPGREGLEAVEADLRRLLDDRPRRLLALVPLGGGRPDHVAGEAVHPVAQVGLVFVQFEREATH